MENNTGERDLSKEIDELTAMMAEVKAAREVEKQEVRAMQERMREEMVQLDRDIAETKKVEKDVMLMRKRVKENAAAWAVDAQEREDLAAARGAVATLDLVLDVLAQLLSTGDSQCQACMERLLGPEAIAIWGELRQKLVQKGLFLAPDAQQTETAPAPRPSPLSSESSEATKASKSEDE